MSETIDLSGAERAMLHQALDGPIAVDPATLPLCLHLCVRQLLQRAGPLSVAQGWRGSPHAFVLTREGWSVLKAERTRRPLRRTA